jgi:hypothetical protein
MIPTSTWLPPVETQRPRRHVVARWGIVLIALALPSAGLSAADMPESAVPYRPIGAPQSPKVDARWNRFYDYTEATALLKQLTQAHPEAARLKSLGRSYGGRKLWLLTVTDRSTGSDRHKPAFWLDGGIHANEIQSVEVTLYTAWYLLEMREQNERIGQLLRRCVFYIVPMMSPDARDAHMYQPATTHAPRTGLRPFDDDRDGLIDEDPADDLDGDGHITQMRVKDDNGRFKPHEKYPHVMVPVEPHERGTYRLLGQEGFDNDGDGRVNEDGPGYYDPNRDWPWRWQPDYVQPGAGAYPLAVPENRRVARFIIDHPNIAAGQSFHNTGGMILRGPGLKSDRYPADDAQVFDTIAERGITILANYRYVKLGEELYEGHGVEIDWLYGMRGVFAFTNELFTPRAYFKSSEPSHFFADKELLARFDRLVLLGEGTIPWHEAEHPEYGKIEVGGLKKNWGRQPPSFMIEEEAHRSAAFLVYHAEQLPLLEIAETEVKPLGGGLTQVTVTIANRRLLPTRAAIDVKHHITPPDVVSIAGAKGKEFHVAAGMVSDEPYFLDARHQPDEPERLRVDSIPGMGTQHVRWLLRGPGPYTVRVVSHKGGRAEARVGDDQEKASP